ncbi:MAG: hypothetical protein CML20_01815 [Rheinheimera sp.]|uniref:DUF7281 domain-containing protein n=1 Tax=Arsukibacterium sp. UBA3155 TaxID=1946058 RepID=UPI000C8FBE99|nr:Wadjet anti-phage system protein JetD domain-containing protein [Arsukibacterium sp. UBA3155]MAD73538.1 hypothetical protein [Rheinheimera sp.]|tara:strand:- start:74157 stop:75026 length:870 start_codon:yes stop_codon:yes gene_type:complete
MSYPPLSAQALRFLQQLQQRLNASGSERVNTSVKATQQVLLWCIEHELVPGNSNKLPHFTFSLALLKDIAVVQRKLQQACFLDDLSHSSRLNNANSSQQELKSIGLQPRQNRVLLRLNTVVDTNLGITAEFIDTNWQQLPLAQFDALLIVENLDCFYQLDAFSLALPYQQPLIIYRGDALYSRGCKALKVAWLTQNKPLLYFGDFDAKGVSIALNEGYSAILLPDFTNLQQHASAAMLPDNQLSFITGIAAKTPATEFKPYQQFLCQQLKGLRQQNMQGISLIPVNLLG